MCGRFALSPKTQDLEKLVPNLRIDKDLQTRYNIAPNQKIAAVTNIEPEQISMLNWGLVPFWAKDPNIGNKLINARSETIESKPSFRTSFKSKRCLIFADGYYEWKKTGSMKIPYFIRLKTTKPFVFAGLWDRWYDNQGNELTTAAIITCSPNEYLSGIHDRMPVILDSNNIAEWLSDTYDILLLKSLLTAYPEEELEAYPVSSLVNNPRNDTPECKKRLEDLF